MGALLMFLSGLLTGSLGGDLLHRLTALAILVAVGLAAFAVLILVLGAVDWRDVLRRLRRQAS
jgi:uncharacterized membrane protein YidH (DUF202 family)